MATSRRISDAGLDAQIAAATKRGARARSAGLRATGVRYDAPSGRVILDLSTGFLVGIPVSVLPALSAASARVLGAVRLSPGGGAIRFEELDADYSVPGLVLAAVGRKLLMTEAARQAGRSSSEAKASAARVNGARGGRPRKGA